MQEHAIPQDVTGYKFHIVGNMTLGQFAQLVAGAIISFLLYQTNLYGFIKWPLIFIVVVVAVVAAFIPIAERPLSHWIKTFFKVLYQPTQFAWRRVPHIPEPFLFKPVASTGPVLPELDLTPLRRQRIQEFLSTTHAATSVDEEAMQVEQYVNHVFSLFDTQSGSQPQQLVPRQVNKPSLRVRTRSMRANPSTPIGLEIALTTPEPTVEVAPSGAAQMDEVVWSAGNALTTARGVEVGARQTTQKDATFGGANNIPKGEMPIIDQTTPQQDANKINGDTPTLSDRMLVTQQQPEHNLTTSKVTFNKELPFPSTPTMPNKLVGMILTPQSELIEGAIIEIRTPTGQVVRAVRSNALGQFYVTTPLANGEYIMVAEKEKYHFDPLSIKLKGGIVDPIEIRSAG